jgi:Uma2 family endonuclease
MYLMPTPRQQEISFAITRAIKQHFTSMLASGRVWQDVEFATPAGERLQPAVCVMLEENAGRVDLDRVPVSGAPDIAIEMIDNSDSGRYLEAGTKEVWQVHPRSGTIEIQRGAGAKTLGSGDVLSSDLLPGFRIKVASVFDV